ncbi:TetR/AcrR family transcriptional regulator [Streptomyces sp. NPDC059009]|uniref:TetR/AcrR family transcriptional regulator n=1 Tax=Streptomyces sp. NPDC059009 TaxID=3346694 RepID=UPI0036C54151
MSGPERELLDARRRTRRADLLAAGVALLGAPERPGVTVRAACRRARLTERYFYESFGDRDAFVREVYAHVGAVAHEVLAGAVADSEGAGPDKVARAAVEAFVQLLVETPETARVLLLAPLREPVLGGQGLALVPAFVALVHDQLSAVTDPAERHMAALGLVGALTNLFIAHLDGTLTVDRQRLTDHCVALVVTANRATR